MKKYQVLLFDVDGTLLDFDKAEKIGIERVLTHFGVPATEENMQKYHHLNKSYWQKLERGEITREQVLSLRFEDYFKDFGITVNGAEVDGLYHRVSIPTLFPPRISEVRESPMISMFSTSFLPIFSKQ